MPETANQNWSANQIPSVYEIVTENIIKQLESGVAPWRKPSTCQTPAKLVTQKEHRGLWVLTLCSVRHSHVLASTHLARDNYLGVVPHPAADSRP